MNQEKEREKRWLAYHMGEISPEEREKIEQELKSSPGEAEEFKRFIEELSLWAKESIPYTSLHLEDLGIEPSLKKEKMSHKGFYPGRWFWGLAAAVLILFALSQASFSLRMGNFSFSWGSAGDKSQVSQLNEKLTMLADELDLLKENSVENQTRIQNVALRNLLLERNIQTAFNQLVYTQQIETRTRYNDFQRLLRINEGGMENPLANTEIYNQDEGFDGQPFLNKSTNHIDPSLHENK